MAHLGVRASLLITSRDGRNGRMFGMGLGFEMENNMEATAEMCA